MQANAVSDINLTDGGSCRYTIAIILRSFCVLFQYMYIDRCQNSVAVTIHNAEDFTEHFSLHHISHHEN